MTEWRRLMRKLPLGNDHGNLSYERLIHTDAFTVLGTLFPDHMTARNLLEDIGADPAVLPAFGLASPAGYWRLVGRELHHGKFLDVDLASLLLGASSLYPGNSFLRDLVSCEAGGAPDGELRVLLLQSSPS